MSGLHESFFRAICLAFSAVILVLFLLTTIDIAVERDRRGRLSREVAELEEDNERLRVQVQNSLSPEAIERYAREGLGMQQAGPGQILYLRSPD